MPTIVKVAGFDGAEPVIRERVKKLVDEAREHLKNNQIFKFYVNNRELMMGDRSKKEMFIEELQREMRHLIDEFRVEPRYLEPQGFPKPPLPQSKP